MTNGPSLTSEPLSNKELPILCVESWGSSNSLPGEPVKKETNWACVKPKGSASVPSHCASHPDEFRRCILEKTCLDDSNVIFLSPLAGAVP